MKDYTSIDAATGIMVDKNILFRAEFDVARVISLPVPDKKP
jgi:hypothetical protein